jgi:hypothetical protein
VPYDQGKNNYRRGTRCGAFLGSTSHIVGA